MASLECTVQAFESEDGTQLTSLPYHVCEETGAQYVLWRDIQQAFEGVSFLKGSLWGIALFEVDGDGELRQPLRLKHRPNVAYVVAYSHHRSLQSTGSQHIHQENSDSLSINTPDNNEIDGPTQNQMHNNSFPHLEELHKYCMLLYWSLASPQHERVPFLQQAANARYYHSIVAKEMERLNQTGLNVQVDGKHQSQILEKLRDLEKQVPQWDYRNVCRSMLNQATNILEFIPPTFFIVLPSDLDSWIVTDPSTHQFRLFFLCNTWKAEGAVEDMPQHMHLSNHPGYVIKRPQEFFQVYGDYLLRMLRMVKHGYSDASNEVPPLDTFKILWNCNPDAVGNPLTRDTLGPLMDKAISYLQELSLPTRNTNLSLTHEEYTAIQAFLEMLGDDNAEGNLCRHIRSGHPIFWTCQSHVNQRFDQSANKHLEEFILSLGGDIDFRQSTLKVQLGSQVEAHQFLMLLISTKHIFDISMKLCWKASRSYMRDLCLGIAKTDAVNLEIDGISLDISPDDHAHYTSNLFADELISYNGLQLITLLNYPRPQEQCIHFHSYSLQSTLPSTHLVCSWGDLGKDLYKFHRMMFEAQVESELNTIAGELQAALAKQGLSNVITVTIHGGDWDVVFDMEKMAFVEVCSAEAAFPWAVLTSGSSLRVTIDYRDDGDCQQDFINKIESNTGIEELNISCYGRDVHYYIDHVVKIWHQSSSSLRLTLLDRMEDTQGRVIAQLARSRGDAEFRGISPVDILEVSADPTLRHEQQVSDDLVDIQFMSWNCDHISGQLSDYSASFLDMATEQHPSVLILLTLDTSQLSRAGLASVQNILGRSSLEHLHILCTSFDPTMSESISQVLGSVPWLTLKTLFLSGDNTDEWIKLWPLSSQAPQLMHLLVHGTESTEQELSHSSVLFLHELVYTSPLQEIHLKNITMKEKHDWELIRAGGVEP